MNIAPEDRIILDALLAEIHDPNTTPERREECRDDHSAIANAYIMEEMFEGEGSAWEIMEKHGIPAVPVEVVSEMIDKHSGGFSAIRKIASPSVLLIFVIIAAAPVRGFAQAQTAGSGSREVCQAFGGIAARSGAKSSTCTTRLENASHSRRQTRLYGRIRGSGLHASGWARRNGLSPF